MTRNIGRRRVLQGFAAMASTVLAHRFAHAQARSLAATSFPGSWEQVFRTIVIPAFQKTNDATVNLVAQNPVETVSKVVASKANPPYDAIILDEGPYLAALQQGIFEKIPSGALPNMKDLPRKFVDPQGYGVYVSGQIIGIAYNTDKIRTPPRSWNDLLKPEYKGRVGLTSMAATLIAAWMVEMAKLGGGNEENMDPAFDFVQRMLPNVGAIATSPGALATLFQQGQIDISVHYSNNVGDMQAKGVPIALAKPDTGFLLIRSTMHIVKNTKQPDLAAAYINTVISPEVQTRMVAAPYFLVPTNSMVAFSAGLQKLAKDMNELETFKTVDWLKLNPHFFGYIDRFNKDVKMGK